MDAASEKIREAVGLFGDMDSLQEAVRELENTAFPRQDISVLGNTSQEQFSASEMAEDDPAAPRASLVRREEQAIGTGALIGSAAYISGAAIGLGVGTLWAPAPLWIILAGCFFGAVAGAIFVKYLSDHYNKEIDNQIKKGGLLLWIRTPDPAREEMACDIMFAHGAKHVRIHELSVQ